MKIELRIQQYHGQTDGHTHTHTEWLLELLVGAKKVELKENSPTRTVFYNLEGFSIDLTTQ